MSKAKVLVVTSGKGGVGKTTSTAALGAALAQAGQNVVVVDFDVGLRNLDLVLGVERRIVYDLTDVVHSINWAFYLVWGRSLAARVKGIAFGLRTTF